MTGPLREELHRLGDAAPVAEVPADTWARAQRARHRDRALVVVAAAAVLAVVGGLVAWLPQRDVPPVADTDGALPSQVWQLPADVDGAAGRPERAAVSYDDASGVADVVLVSADDGAYHRLDLPGSSERADHLAGGTAAPLLSPDGTLLAYPYAEDLPAAGSAGVASTGVRVVKLADGAVSDFPLTGGLGVLVTSMSWSPDGDQLLWTGQVARELTDFTARSAPGTRAGVLSLVGPPMNLPDLGARSGPTSFAVDETGLVARVAEAGVTIPYPVGRGQVTPNPVPGTWPTSATLHEGHWGALLVGMGPDAQRIEELATSVGGSVRHASLPAELESASPTPVAWPDADRLVVLDLLNLGSPTRLMQLTIGDDEVSVDELVGLPDGVLTDLSIATDLVPADGATRDTPVPPWEDETAAWGWWVGGGLALVLLTAASVWGMRRARS